MVPKKKRLEERKKPLKKAKPPNLLNITLFWACLFQLAFAFLACILEVTPSLQACTCNNKRNTKPTNKPEEKRQANKIQPIKGQTNILSNKHVVKQTCFQAKRGVLERKYSFGFGVHSSIILKFPSYWSTVNMCAIKQSS